jgi:Lrp/AsnC family transcriptional regulator, leucine-responsive regulatory protein
MDDKDRLLISLLKRDGRRPIVALARDLNLSRSATQARLSKLVTTGEISGFTIFEGKPNAVEHVAHFLIRLEKGKTCAQIMPKLKLVPFVISIHSVAGLFDLVVRLDAGSMIELESSRSKIAAVVGIAEVTTLITLERHLG